MAHQIGSVSISDIQPPEGKGSDERDLEASLANEGLDPDPDPELGASAEPESRGPEKGELREETADEDAFQAGDDDGELDAEASADGQPPKPPSPTAAPAPPEGYASWEEAKKAAEEARKLTAWAEYGRNAYLQSQQARQQPPAQQHQQEEQPPPSWDPPGFADEGVRRAYEQVVGAADPTKALAALPPGLQAKVNDAHAYVESRWAGYRADPTRFYEEQVRPHLERSRFAQELNQLREYVGRLEAQRFLAEHAPVLKDDGDRKALAGLMADGMSRDHAIRLMKAEKAAQVAGQAKAKVDDRARSQQAQKQAARANQAAKKGAGRTGTPSADVKPSTDFAATFRQLKSREANR